MDSRSAGEREESADRTSSPERPPAGRPQWHEQPSVPQWVHSIDAAVWVTNEDGRIEYMNPPAGELLGTAPDSALGQRCCDVVAGVNASDAPVCSADCWVHRHAREGRKLGPVRMRVGPTSEERRWAHIQTMVDETDCGAHRWVVHLAMDVDRCQKMDAYLREVASRSSTAPRRPSPLSKRESEILVRLAEDRDAAAIARELHISYATVRNHIRNLLAKLGVHSILEAIALHLVEYEPEEEDASR